jgi:hypothetical protein
MREPTGLVEPGSDTWRYLCSAPGFTILPCIAYDPSKVVLRAGDEKIVKTGRNVAKLIQVMDYISGYSTSSGFSAYGDAGIQALIQKARNCDPSIAFLPSTKSKGTPIGKCAAYVKMGLAGAGYTDNYISCEHAKDMGSKLSTIGFADVMGNVFGTKQKVQCSEIPTGAVIVYTGGNDGHIEIWSGSQFMSDYISNRGRTSEANALDMLPKNGRSRTVKGIWVK